MRRRRPSTLLAILIAGTTYTYWGYVKYVLAAIILLFVARLVIKLVRKFRIVRRNLYLRDIDTMNGIDFEYYIAQLLVELGCDNVSLTEKYDYGVDIVAEKDGVRWGIQVKRHSGLVKAAAVRQVVTGLRLYGCDRAMVITNSTFSNVAQRLAAGNDCILIDRTRLDALVRLKRKDI
jgi:restriction system protein